MCKITSWALLVLTLAGTTMPAWSADDLLTSQLVDEARQWQLKGRDDLAAELWRKLLRTHQKHPEALTRLAAIEARFGNPKEAEALLQRAEAATKSIASEKAGPATPSSVKEASKGNAAKSRRSPDETVIRQRQRTLSGTTSSAAAKQSVISKSSDSKKPEPPQPTPTQNNQAKAMALLASVRGQAQTNNSDSIARSQLESALLLDPVNAQVRLELARVYQALGLQEEAANLLDSLLDSQPSLSEALQARAMLYAAQQNWSNGLDLLERIPAGARSAEAFKEQQKMWVNVQVQRARQLFALAHFKQAMALMDQAQDGARQDGALLAIVASGWSDLGQSTKALYLMRALVNTDSMSRMETRIKYAEMLLNAHQDAELSALLRDLSIPGRLTTNQQEDVNRIIIGYTLRITETLRESGRLAEAAEVINPALQRFDDVRLLSSMARIYQSAGNLDAAMELVERVIAREPDDVGHRLLACDIALTGNDLDRAKGHANAALELAPNHPRTLTAAGRVEKSSGNTAKALAYFQRSQTLEASRDEYSTTPSNLALRLIDTAPVVSKALRVPQNAAEVERSGLLPVPDFSPLEDRVSEGALPVADHKKPPSGNKGVTP